MRIFECLICQEKIETNKTHIDKCTNPECNSKKFRIIPDTGCEFCGERDTDFLIMHHIIPKGLNGSDDDTNKIILCANCHRKLHNEIKRLIIEYTVNKIFPFPAVI